MMDNSKKYEVAGLTDVGLVRSNNEDSFLIDRDLDLFIVADGMGGYQKGEVASKITCESIRDYVQERFEQKDRSFSEDHFKQSVQKANADIRSRIMDSPGLDKMGSTVVSLLLKNEGVFIVNVGDSRAYRLRDNRLEQVSIDHSLIQETKAAGIKRQLPSQFKNIVTRAVGMKKVVEPDVYFKTARKNDLYLLCSDGLHGYVPDKKIRELLLAEEDLQSRVRLLIQAAKEAGGKDNITCILIRLCRDSETTRESMTETIDLPREKDKSPGSAWAPSQWTLVTILILLVICLVVLIFI
jgi:protein phosphatase